MSNYASLNYLNGDDVRLLLLSAVLLCLGVKQGFMVITKAVKVDKKSLQMI